jgi:hypothetical protein
MLEEDDLSPCGAAFASTEAGWSPRNVSLSVAIQFRRLRG